MNEKMSERKERIMELGQRIYNLYFPYDVERIVIKI